MFECPKIMRFWLHFLLMVGCDHAMFLQENMSYGMTCFTGRMSSSGMPGFCMNVHLEYYSVNYRVL